ncbi:MAG: monovalent cation/H+ antiporter complex subunit F [Tissierellales bacterium]|jgi:multicomponent Na+:H+ antiporter subunit F|nr:monovalent cation/H+ antiporter complex subunit F [Tissierellales bacterium]
MLKATCYILIFAILVLVIYLLRSKNVWERVMVINLLSIKTILLITVFAVLMDLPVMLDITITYSIIGFVAITLISRFLLSGGRLK